MSRAKTRRLHRRSMFDQGCLLRIETKTKIGDEIVTIWKLKKGAGYIALKTWARGHSTKTAEGLAWLERKKAA